MLQSMRDGAQSIVIKVILFSMLGFAMMGLVVMDVGGVFQSGLQKSTVIKIGDREISAVDFDRAVRSELQSRNIPIQDIHKSDVIKQTIKREVQNVIFHKATRSAGIRIDNSIIAFRLKEILKPIVSDDTSEKDALQRLLYSQGNISEGMLVASLKQQIASEKLLNAVSASKYVPQQLLNDAWRYQNEKRSGKFITVKYSDVKNIAPPTDDTLKSYYATIKRQYATAERRSFSYIVLNSKNTLTDMSIDESELEDAYEERIADYSTGEKRHIAQLIIKDEETGLKALALIKSGSSLKAISKNKDFKSTFIASAAYDKKSLPEELAEIAFATDKGQTTSVPIKTPFGWHILFIKDIDAAKTSSFAEVKNELKIAILAEKAEDRIFEIANEIEDSLAGGASLSEMASEMSLTVKTIKNITVKGLDENDKPVLDSLNEPNKILDAIFSLAINEDAQTIETDNGDIIFAKTNDITLSKTIPLDTVKKEIQKKWFTQERKNIAKKKATTIIDELKSDKNSLASLAKSYKLSLVKTGVIQRRESKNKDIKIDNIIVQALFVLDKKGDNLHIPTTNGEVIIQLSNIDIPKANIKTTENDDNNAFMKNLISNSMREDILEQYRLSLIQEYDVEINERTLNSLYPKNDKDS